MKICDRTNRRVRISTFVVATTATPARAGRETRKQKMKIYAVRGGEDTVRTRTRFPAHARFRAFALSLSLNEYLIFNRRAV